MQLSAILDNCERICAALRDFGQIWQIAPSEVVPPLLKMVPPLLRSSAPLLRSGAPPPLSLLLSLRLVGFNIR